MKKYISILLALFLILGVIIYLFLAKSDLGKEIVKKTKGIEEVANEINSSFTNIKYLPNKKLNPNIKASVNIEDIENMI